MKSNFNGQLISTSGLCTPLSSRMISPIVAWLMVSPVVAAFSTGPKLHDVHVDAKHLSTPTSNQHRVKLRHRSSFMGNGVQQTPFFDPTGLASSESEGMSHIKTTLSVATVLAPLTLYSDKAIAASSFSTGDLDPSNFNPVCPASDGVYRFLQGSTEAVVGEGNFVEYGPLIAGGLLRIRLELCVVESFFNEAVAPFIQKNGLSWILPLHETVETFLAGTIFSLATTFILVGSTKIVAVIATYFDVFVGGPARLFGTFFFDRARGKPVTLDVGFGPFKTRVVGPPQEEIDQDGVTTDLSNFQDANVLSLFIILLSGIVKTGGEALKIVRDVFDLLDLFVGRYLVLIATGYILIKFVHFKVFPDFPPGF